MPLWSEELRTEAAYGTDTDPKLLDTMTLIEVGS